MNIILIGFKKCGKTSLGKLLSNRLNKALIDIDRLIELKYSSSNRFSYFEIYEKEGEKKFRALEKKVVASLRGAKNAIIATGGGTLLDSNNLKTLKNLGQLFYLYLRSEVIKKRIEKGRVPSFLLENFDEAFSVRDHIFQKNADHIIDVSELNIESSTYKILSKINGK